MVCLYLLRVKFKRENDKLKRARVRIFHRSIFIKYFFFTFWTYAIYLVYNLCGIRHK